MKIEKFLEASPLFAIQENSQALSKFLSPYFKEEGINFLQGLILISLLFEQDKDVFPSAFVKVFKTSKSSVSQAISALEYKGFIKRRLGPSDARSYNIILCKEGMESANRLIAVLDKLQLHFEKHLGEKKIRSMIVDLMELNKTLTILEKAK